MPPRTSRCFMRVVDLFCGAGGMSAGFMAADFAVVAAFDAWPDAVACHNHNLSEHAQVADLSDIGDAIDRVVALRPDIVVGGPPCQDFSLAGHRDEGARAALTSAFALIAAAAKPRVVVMENVRAIQSSRALNEALAVLSEAGYRTFGTVLDASRYGVPQRRIRYFLWAALDADPAGVLVDHCQDMQSKKPMTVAEYMGEEIDVDAYWQCQRHMHQRSVFSVHEPAPTIRSSARPKFAGQAPHPNDAGPLSEARELTTAERSRIQTFPADWDWGDHQPKWAINTMIANAVPPVLAQFVAEATRAVCEGVSTPTPREGRLHLRWPTPNAHRPDNVGQARSSQPAIAA